MRDGALPAILLCLMLGLLLASAVPRTRVVACGVLVLVALAASALALPLDWRTQVAAGCWGLTALLVVGVYFVRPLSAGLAVPATILAGILTGAQASELGRPSVLLAALPGVLVSLPAGWLIGRGWSIAVKVLASWLLAVALLAGGTTITSGTSAGSDHLD